MQAMNMREASMVTGISRHQLKMLMETGQWDIGEVVQLSKRKRFIIWSHKLADAIGVPEEKVVQELERIDHEKRMHK